MWAMPCLFRAPLGKRCIFVDSRVSLNHSISAATGSVGCVPADNGPRSVLAPSVAFTFIIVAVGDIVSLTRASGKAMASSNKRRFYLARLRVNHVLFVREYSRAPLASPGKRRFLVFCFGAPSGKPCLVRRRVQLDIIR